MVRLDCKSQCIKTLFHVSDLHLPPDGSRSEEFMCVVTHACSVMQEDSSVKRGEAALVVTGDVFDRKDGIPPETMKLFCEIFTKFLEILPVIVIRGNHDFQQSAPDRTDRMRTIFEQSHFVNAPPGLHRHRLHYLHTTGIYEYGDVVFGILDLADTLDPNSGCGIRPDGCPNMPDPTASSVSPNKRVALFHGTVRGALMYAPHPASCECTTYSPGMFRHYHLALLGDVHRHQHKRIVDSETGMDLVYTYAGSMVCTNFGEDFDGHGMSRVDIATRTITHVELKNEYAHVTFYQRPSGDSFSFKYDSSRADGETGRRLPVSAISSLDWFPGRPKARVHGATADELKCALPQTIQPHSIRVHRNVKSLEDYCTDRSTHTEDTGPNWIEHNDPRFWASQIQKMGVPLSVAQKNLLHQPESLHLPPCCTSIADVSDVFKSRSENIDKLLSAYASLDTRVRMCRVRPTRLKFSNMKCYGHDNYIDFKRMRGCVALLAGENMRGKSSVVECLHKIIYNTRTLATTKHYRTKLTESINRVDKHGRVVGTSHGSLEFEVDGEEVTLMRSYRADGNTSTGYPKLLMQDGKSVNKDKNVRAWLEERLGTAEHAAMGSFITSKDTAESDIFSKGAADQESLLSKPFNISPLKAFAALLEESWKYHKDMLAKLGDLPAKLSDQWGFKHADSMSDVMKEQRHRCDNVAMLKLHESDATQAHSTAQQACMNAALGDDMAEAERSKHVHQDSDTKAIRCRIHEITQSLPAPTRKSKAYSLSAVDHCIQDCTERIASAEKELALLKCEQPLPQQPNQDQMNEVERLQSMVQQCINAAGHPCDNTLVASSQSQATMDARRALAVQNELIKNAMAALASVQSHEPQRRLHTAAERDAIDQAHMKLFEARANLKSVQDRGAKHRGGDVHADTHKLTKLRSAWTRASAEHACISSTPAPLPQMPVPPDASRVTSWQERAGPQFNVQEIEQHIRWVSLQNRLQQSRSSLQSTLDHFIASTGRSTSRDLSMLQNAKNVLSDWDTASMHVPTEDSQCLLRLVEQAAELDHVQTSQRGRLAAAQDELDKLHNYQFNPECASCMANPTYQRILCLQDIVHECSAPTTIPEDLDTAKMLQQARERHRARVLYEAGANAASQLHVEVALAQSIAEDLAHIYPIPGAPTDSDQLQGLLTQARMYDLERIQMERERWDLVQSQAQHDTDVQEWRQACTEIARNRNADVARTNNACISTTWLLASEEAAAAARSRLAKYEAQRAFEAECSAARQQISDEEAALSRIRASSTRSIEARYAQEMCTYWSSAARAHASLLCTHAFAEVFRADLAQATQADLACANEKLRAYRTKVDKDIQCALEEAIHAHAATQEHLHKTITMDNKDLSQFVRFQQMILEHQSLNLELKRRAFKCAEALCEEKRGAERSARDAWSAAQSELDRFIQYTEARQKVNSVHDAVKNALNIIEPLKEAFGKPLDSKRAESASESGSAIRQGLVGTIYEGHILPIFCRLVNEFLDTFTSIRLVVEHGRLSVASKGLHLKVHDLTGYQGFCVNLGIRSALHRMGMPGFNFSILIIDEGFAGLDDKHIGCVRHMMQALLRVGRYDSVLVLTHNPIIKEAVDVIIDIDVDTKSGARHVQW